MINRLARMGMHMQSIVLTLLALLGVALVVALLIQRQNRMQHHVAAYSRETLQQVMEDRWRQCPQRHAWQLGIALAGPLLDSDLEEVVRIANLTSSEPDVTRVRVLDGENRLLHEGMKVENARRLPMAELPGDVEVEARLGTIDPELAHLAAEVRILRQGRLIGAAEIGYSLAASRDADAARLARLDHAMSQLADQHRLLISLLLAGIGALALFSMLWVQRRYVRPILRLAQSVRAVEHGIYDLSADAASASVRGDELGELERAFARMVASVREHDNEIRRIAFTDALTGLPNRHDFRQRLEARLQILGEGDALALLFVDVDDFKRINDTSGHEAGDQVLIDMAARVRRAVHQAELRHAEISRFGGDEFVILLEANESGIHAASAAAARLAQALVASCAQPVELAEGKQVFLGASIGISLFPGDAVGAESLIKHGDIAMYQAKTSGKHCYRFYNRDMGEVIQRRMRMEQELHGAWERGELHLTYQPIVRLQDRRVVGAEALLVWEHPRDGLVAPSAFIAVAEASGLIDQLGPQVLRKACSDAMQWHAAAGTAADGLPLFVSVNLSMRQLRDAGLVQQVAAILSETRLPAHALRLELTETMVLDEIGDSLGTLRRLRALGVKLWLDDFGTGFSCLSQLRRLPVDGVKIDRTFITDLLHDRADLLLTEAIIGMAHTLDLRVVAEGIEERGQFDWLRKAGCDMGQGFWLGRPVSAAQFRRLLG
ncbi:putative bifunctional diguanylate cyclase/phosphodiesterase [Luteimonas sp. e5]